MIKADKRKKVYCCMYSCKKELTEEDKAMNVRIDICKKCLISLQKDNS